MLGFSARFSLARWRRVLLACGLSLVLASCNFYSTPPPSSPVPTAGPTRIFTPAATGQTSDNWAGYVIQTSDSLVTIVSGQWVIPTILCGPDKSYSAIWVGIDGSSDKTVEQVGTGQDCANGQAAYYAWFEIFPRPSYELNQLPIHPGDTVRAEVVYLTNDQFKLTLTNITSGQNFTISRTDKGARRRSAEWIVEAPFNKTILPLTNFGTVQISQAQTTIQGKTTSIGASTWRSIAVVMTNTRGATKAQPSTLSPDGASFAVRWQSK